MWEKVILTAPSLRHSLLKLCPFQELLRYGIIVAPKSHLSFLLQTHHVSLTTLRRCSLEVRSRHQRDL